MTNNGYQGTATPENTAGEFNAMSFMVNQILNRVNTSTLVKVVACTNTGTLSAVGFVDVVPMVHQVDGQGKPVPYTTISNLPYFRLQGGANAFIIDPQVGDIGVAIFASRDLSKVKSTKANALPGTPRKYSIADGMYFGGMLNGVPIQYVRFDAAGITITSPTQLIINAPIAVINSSTSLDITSPVTTIHGKLTVTDKITGQNGAAISGADVVVTGADVKADTISLKTHHTLGVTPGTGTSGLPTP